MAEKVTVMVIKVDLDCEKCYSKIKKVLCKIPQIRNQVYDTKANTVTITVVCCSPEKIKMKICCKGGESVKGIEIKLPEKPKEPEKPKDKPKDKPKQPEKTKVVVTEQPPPQEPQQPKPAPPPKTPEPASVLPNPGTCCRECYEGYGGGPCFHRFGRIERPCYEQYGYGRPVYDSWGGGGCSCQRAGYYVCRCEYVGEDDRSGCKIM